jgi:hypothetical protein
MSRTMTPEENLRAAFAVLCMGMDQHDVATIL